MRLMLIINLVVPHQTFQAPLNVVEKKDQKTLNI
jgi:hypothetical protein